MNSDLFLKLLIGAAVLWFVALLSSVVVGHYHSQTLRHECILALKDKAATDIQAVCK